MLSCTANRMDLNLPKPWNKVYPSHENDILVEANDEWRVNTCSSEIKFKMIARDSYIHF